MVSSSEDKEFRKRIERIEILLQEIEANADPAVQARTREIVQTLLDYHGIALSRMLDAIGKAGEAGQSILGTCARDELVGSMLLLYGLHPLDIESRVLQGLEKVRPYLRSHGGNVELLEMNEGAVLLRMQGSCHGCPSSAMTLKHAIEEAIYEAAPDVTAIEVEGETESPLSAEPVAARVSLPLLHS